MWSLLWKKKNEEDVDDLPPWRDCVNIHVAIVQGTQLLLSEDNGLSVQ